MTPEQFIATWKNNKLTERGGAQAHFDDLCELLDVDKPRDPDNYCFERGAKKSGGGDGWADVWKRGFFGWENKKPGRDLDLALKQLTDYALKLESPPLLVVSDRERIIIHTAFTGYPDELREIRIDELTDPGTRQLLRWVFTQPEKLRPEKSTATITALAAGQFANIAKDMRANGLDGQRVAHFLVQCLFCMFAEDENLLPSHVFTELLKNAKGDPEKASKRIAKLFAAMQQKTGGEYGDQDIAWFNGGLFKTIDIPPLTPTDLSALHQAAADMDWRAIDPTIFGTLFEHGLDPAERAQLGANYTDTATIDKIITPLITAPLMAEWASVKAVIAAGLNPTPGAATSKGKSKGKTATSTKTALAAYQGFLLRLNTYSVLDPACGSGNFLYLALKALRDVEKLASVEARELGLSAELSMQTGPHNIRGLEINEFAAELARVTVWIGDIQWCRRNGYAHATHPILKPLESIEHRDALLNPDGSEAQWPDAEVIVGNPPFLGGSKKRGELGDDYFNALAKTFTKDRVPPGADLVCYWFDKARIQIETGKCQRAGLVSTNSIRGGANQTVLARICETLRIFTAWSDEPWVNEGAAVRVSLVCFAPVTPVSDAAIPAQAGIQSPMLDGQAVATIHADLTCGTGLNLTQAKPLHANEGVSFQGSQKIGPFDIDGDLARQWLALPNPNGRSSSDVLKPSWNGMDVTRRPRDGWIIDFGTVLGESGAALYETPFDYVTKHVKPERVTNNREAYRKYWWRHGEPRIAMRASLSGLPRYFALSAVTKHIFWRWLDCRVLPDKALIVISRADDTTFGILHSRFHELWALRMCTWMGVGNDPRYTPSTSFDTFPFPSGLTPMDTASQKIETLPGGAIIPAWPPATDEANDSEQNGPAAPVEYAQAATKTVATIALPIQQQKAGVGRRSGAISKSEAYEPPASAPLLLTTSQQRTKQATDIAQAAHHLNQQRENWLNPTPWVDWVQTPEEKEAGYPKRPVAKPGFEAELKKRTLTNLYNARPAWLTLAHQALDKAVALAYDWPDYTAEMPDDEILRRLLALNLARSAPTI
jgi:type II restriction/modification system DNA methylase subunit YeeA